MQVGGQRLIQLEPVCQITSPLVTVWRKSNGDNNQHSAAYFTGEYWAGSHSDKYTLWSQWKYKPIQIWLFFFFFSFNRMTFLVSIKTTSSVFLLSHKPWLNHIMCFLHLNNNQKVFPLTPVKRTLHVMRLNGANTQAKGEKKGGYNLALNNKRLLSACLQGLYLQIGNSIAGQPSSQMEIRWVRRFIGAVEEIKCGDMC